MNSKPVKPAPEEQQKNGEVQNIKEYWTEHRTTLIAFEAQYIYNKKEHGRKEEEEKDANQKNKKGKKKDIEFDGSFLFPGKGDEKQINVVEMIKEASKYPTLKELFDESINHSEDMQELRQFVKIMLELKHHTIVKEFLQIYEIIIKDIKDVKFEHIKAEKDRFAFISKVSDKVAGYVINFSYNFKYFSGYMQSDKKETIKLFEVTAYCFLAEKHNFNINQFYSEAFELPDTEKKTTGKKNKTEKEDHDS